MLVTKGRVGIMNLDALSSALAYVRREWGGSDDGYSIEAVRGAGLGCVIVDVVHNDGSRFTVAANRWGVPLDPETGAEYRYIGGRWMSPAEYDQLADRRAMAANVYGEVVR